MGFRVQGFPVLGVRNLATLNRTLPVLSQRKMAIKALKKKKRNLAERGRRCRRTQTTSSRRQLAVLRVWGFRALRLCGGVQGMWGSRVGEFRVWGSGC